MALNESPSEKEGKFVPIWRVHRTGKVALNESPSEKEGKSQSTWKRFALPESLNESPSEKEGK